MACSWNQIFGRIVEKGRYVSEFDEISFLGGGANGRAYLCRRRHDGVLSAVKKIPLGDFTTDSSKQIAISAVGEVRKMSFIPPHPNVVAYKDSWFDTDVTEVYDKKGRLTSLESYYLMIEMEYIKGISIGSLLKSNDFETRILPEFQIWNLFFGLASGLRHLHECGLVHRDFKPENLLLEGDKEGCDKCTTCTGFVSRKEDICMCKHRRQDHCWRTFKRVVIADFGVSQMVRELSSNRQRTGYTGTLAYMAPELLERDERGHFCRPCNERIDVWSLGVVLYELAFSQPLFCLRTGSMPAGGGGLHHPHAAGGADETTQEIPPTPMPAPPVELLTFYKTQSHDNLALLPFTDKFGDQQQGSTSSTPPPPPEDLTDDFLNWEVGLVNSKNNNSPNAESTSGSGDLTTNALAVTTATPVTAAPTSGKYRPSIFLQLPPPPQIGDGSTAVAQESVLVSSSKSPILELSTTKLRQEQSVQLQQEAEEGRVVVPQALTVMGGEISALSFDGDALSLSVQKPHGLHCFNKVEEDILSKKFVEFPAFPPRTLELKRILTAMLTVDPQTRPTVAEILDLPFVAARNRKFVPDAPPEPVTSAHTEVIKRRRMDVIPVVGGTPIASSPPRGELMFAAASASQRRGSITLIEMTE